MHTPRSLGSSLVVTFVAVACARRTDASPSAPSVAPSSSPAPSRHAVPSPPPRSAFNEFAEVPPPPADMPCDDMTAPQCMRSTRCVLDAPPSVGGLYVCREGRPPCEVGLAQGDPGFPEACAARAGCRVEVGRCVCFPQTRVTFRTRLPVPSCFCGGGPPRRCVPSDPGAATKPGV